MKRRKFISLTAGTAAFSTLSAHSLLAHTANTQMSVPNSPLISSLRLLTIAPLGELKKFYTETIGLPLIAHESDKLIIQAGLTCITFTKSDQANRPFYHFAFNIPENKIQEAFEWQRKRTPIVHPNPAAAKDKIVHFEGWNAHSIFFIDPAGNLVEYIARHTLPNAGHGNFSAMDILYASEIGFVVENVLSSGNELMKGLNLKEYRQPSDVFWPIGDENGLLLMIIKGKEWSSNSNENNVTDIFKTSVTISSSECEKWKFQNFPYEIICSKA